MRVPGTGRVRAVAAWLRRRSPRGLILLYHRVAGSRFDPMLLDVTPERFDRHLRILRAESALMPLDEFERRRRSGTLPRRAVAITFDDGYADNLHAAAPILGRYDVPATVFVTTGMVGASGEFWWDDVERIAFSAATDRRWNITSAGDRTFEQHRFLELCEQLRALPSAERDASVTALREQVGVGTEARPTHRALTHDELRTLAATPGISIGAHTVSHPVLSAQPAAVQVEELAASRAVLEATLGRPVPFAAYPFGTSREVDAATRDAARRAGFDAAFANVGVAAWRWSPRFAVPRLLVRDWDDAEFRLALAAASDGAW